MGELGKCLFATICLMMALAAHVRAQGQGDQLCFRAQMWKPADDQLKQILEAHHQWAEEWAKNGFSDEWAGHPPQGRASLCRADLRGAQLARADLRGADLREAHLSQADLGGADLRGASLIQ